VPENRLRRDGWMGYHNWISTSTGRSEGGTINRSVIYMLHIIGDR